MLAPRKLSDCDVSSTNLLALLNKTHYPPLHCLKVTECDQHCRDRSSKSKLSSSHFSWSSEEAFKVMVMTPPSDSSSSPGSPSLQPMLGVPRAELYARPNSHPFQNRVLLFTGPDQQIKVGRSVARCQSYKTIFSSSLTEDQNKLECLSLSSLSSLV